MRFLYLVSKGAQDATGASVPVHLAVNGSAEIGHETHLLLVGDGTDVAIPSKTDGLAGLGVPPMTKLLSKLREHQIPVYV